MPITKASGQAVAPAAKGDLVVGSATNDAAVLGVGSANQVLTVDSSTTTGLKWAAVSGGAGNLVQIATGSLTGASVTISSLSSYTELLLLIESSTFTPNNGRPYFRINNNSGSNYQIIGQAILAAAASQTSWIESTTIQAFTYDSADRTVPGTYIARFFNCKNAGFTSYDINSPYYSAGSGTSGCWGSGIYKVSEAVSSLVIASLGGNWNGGTYTLYGG